MDSLPRFLLVDLDDTILSFGDRREILRRLWAEVGEGGSFPIPNVLIEELDMALDRFWADTRLSQHWGHRLRESRIETFGPVFERYGIARATAETMANRFQDVRDQDLGRPFEHVREVLVELQRCGHRLGMLTNGVAALQRRKIAEHDLGPLFEVVQIDEEAGVGKPDPRSYLMALERLGGNPGEAGMIGDSLEWEVAVPQRLGMKGIWHDPYHKGLSSGSEVRPDHTFHRWLELLAIP